MCIQDYLQCTKQLYAFGYRIPQVRSTKELSAGAQEWFRSDLVIGNKENDDQVRFLNSLVSLGKRKEALPKPKPLDNFPNSFSPLPLPLFENCPNLPCVCWDGIP